MSFLDPQNPGIGGLKQFTTQEALVVSQIAALGVPPGNRILGYDTTDANYAYFLIGTGLSYDHASHTLSASASGSGDASTNTAVSVDSEVVLFSGTTGKLLKRAAITGIAKLTSGVLTAAVAGDFPTLNQNTSGTAANVTGIVAPANGGTGIANNAASTLTISGAFATTVTVTAITSVTLPTSGTLYGTATGSITSAQLLNSLSDETGTGVAVFATSPTFTTSILAAAATANIGSTTTGWANLYLATGGNLNWGNGNAVITHATGVVNVSTGDLRVAYAGSNSASVVILQAAQTVTNKRITKRITTQTSSATPTIPTDTTDFYSLTALAANVTSFTTNLTGTPTDGQTLWIAITDNGTARTLAWGASFEASTVALPTTTVISTRLDVGFVWNTATSKWRCVASA